MIIRPIKLSCYALVVFLLLVHSVHGESNAKPIRVAIYTHAKEPAKVKTPFRRILAEREGFQCQLITPKEIRQGKLQHFDVLIMPGGSGSKQGKNLEASGREKIREFVRNGGGYVSFCAGSYLATNDYDWSLGLLNAKVLDRKHWARGNGKVQLDLTAEGQKTLKHKDAEVTVYYHQGPLLAPGTDRSLPPYEPLATFKTEIAKNGAPKGIMLGTTAIARSVFGKGRVVCFSPHPESKTGPNSFVVHAVRWSAEMTRTKNPAKSEIK